MNRTRITEWLRWAAAAGAVALVAACGGGGDAPPAAQREVATVRIDPDAVLFTRSGETRALRARAFDAQGVEIDGLAATWASTNAAVVAVDASGQARADAVSGSSQVTATINGVRSAPLLAAVSAMPAGTVVLADADVAGDPRESAGNGPRGTPGNTMEFTLAAGVAPPPVGTLVVGNGAKPVAGRVSAVDAAGGQTVVRLLPASMRELFPNLSVNEVIDMSRAEVRFNPDIAARYDITRSGNRYDFRPRPGATSSSGTERARALGAAVGTRRAIPPFRDCKGFTITGVGEDGPNPIALTVPPAFSVAVEPSLEFVNTPARGLERLVVKAQPAFGIEAGIGVALAFEGKYECKVVLYEIFVPVSGALSVIAGGIIPIGVGFEAGGKLTLVNFAIGAKTSTTADVELGIACAAPSGCGVVNSVGNFRNTIEPSITMPSLEGDNVRVEASLGLFGYAEVEFGSRLFQRLRFDVVKAKVSGTLEGEFAPQRAQLADTEFRANYGAKVGASAEVGTDLSGLAAHFGIDELTFLSLSVEVPLAESPQGTVTADRARFNAGDLVRFDVSLDPAKVKFIPSIGPYNVRAVVLVRRLADGSTQEVVRQTASDDQTHFRFDVSVPAEGAAGDYHAFVLTRLLAFEPLLLELGRATAPNVQVAVSPGGSILAPGASQAFTAVVTGTTQTGVTWSASAGSITASGVLTAPQQPGSLTITATSVADPSVAASVTVTVVGSASGVRVVGRNAILDLGQPDSVTCPTTRFDDFGSETNFDFRLSCVNQSGGSEDASLSSRSVLSGSDLVGLTGTGITSVRDARAAHSEYILHFTATRTTQLVIDASFTLPMQNAGAGLSLVRDGVVGVIDHWDGSPIRQTLTLLPGAYRFSIYAQVQDPVVEPSASAGFSLQLAFGP